MAPTPNAFRTAQVTVASTPTLLCAAKTDRRAVTIINPSTTNVYIGDANVTTVVGALLPGVIGASITIHTTAAVYGIVGASTQNVSVIETYS